MQFKCDPTLDYNMPIAAFTSIFKGKMNVCCMLEQYKIVYIIKLLRALKSFLSI